MENSSELRFLSMAPLLLRLLTGMGAKALAVAYIDAARRRIKELLRDIILKKFCRRVAVAFEGARRWKL